ncbi:MAG TPA: FMN-binding protein [Candidatus Saccharimonadales bacterium]|nr:FMN-binding protein [Candidatus Saccharimonadales bacterium]
MKKILLSVGVIGIFILYSLHQRDEANSVHPTSQDQLPLNSVGSDSSGNPAISSAPSATSNNSVTFKSGTFTGDVADAYYGNLQVSATIVDGKITDVQFIQYPNDVHESRSINTQAMPYLKQEAIQAQNSQVDIVSGATQSSEAFRQSLQSALTKART